MAHLKNGDAVDNEYALEQYKNRSQALLALCEQWCDGLGLTLARGIVDINEERHGNYQISTLVLTNSQGNRMAEIVPFGASILGAWGRVDIVGEYGKREKIVYLSAGGPTMTWSSNNGQFVKPLFSDDTYPHILVG